VAYWWHGNEWIVALHAAIISICPTPIVLSYKMYDMKHKLALFAAGFGGSLATIIISLIFDLMH